MDTEQKQNLMGKIYHCLTMDNPDCATAAQLIDQLLSDPEYRAQEGTGFWLAELSRCLAAQGRYVEAAATMERAIQVGLTGLPDGRADIAAYWLHIGRAKEAGELFAALRDEMPEAVWLYQSAGMAYQAVDRHEEALRWLTLGLRLALRLEEPDEIVVQLSRLRRVSLAKLGFEADKLEHEADIYVTAHEAFANEVVENPWR
ncbi:MAG TPA: hypothetical protein GXZ82_02770 [Firmicutes bacterium]|jgi:tetratricopeptide (TPR) repeat protein|nr:hypothetical protein [Bacillota bacterium]